MCNSYLELRMYLKTAFILMILVPNKSLGSLLSRVALTTECSFKPQDQDLMVFFHFLSFLFFLMFHTELAYSSLLYWL